MSFWVCLSRNQHNREKKRLELEPNFYLQPDDADGREIKGVTDLFDEVVDEAPRESKNGDGRGKI